MTLPTESENCILVTVTDEEVDNVVKHIPKLETLVREVVIGPATSGLHTSWLSRRFMCQVVDLYVQGFFVHSFLSYSSKMIL